MTTVHDTPGAFSCHPIAFVRSPYARRIDAPHQSTVVAGTETQAAAEATIEFVDGFPAAAWRDLAGFERRKLRGPGPRGLLLGAMVRVHLRDAAHIGVS